jgi:hypothetical protein
VIPPMPLFFLPVWLGVGFALGWWGWRTQREGWLVAMFVWFMLVGPICWLLVGGLTS